ncbi:hypothetical protein [Brevibacillus reuszeri]|uniref:hypothetical protein n=1 Tax=Brevibacillus reuszeri TaxID=54915 RepID=UPI003D257231
MDPEGTATVMYTKANGTLTSEASSRTRIAGTEVTGLTNGTTYKVEEASPAYAIKVKAGSESVVTNVHNIFFTVNTEGTMLVSELRGAVESLEGSVHSYKIKTAGYMDKNDTDTVNQDDLLIVYVNGSNTMDAVYRIYVD